MKRLIVDICGSRILPLPLNSNNFLVDFGILLPFSTWIFFVKVSYSLELFFGGHTLCRWHIFIYNKQNILPSIFEYIPYHYCGSISFEVFFMFPLFQYEILCIWQQMFLSHFKIYFLYMCDFIGWRNAVVIVKYVNRLWPGIFTQFAHNDRIKLT